MLDGLNASSVCSKIPKRKNSLNGDKKKWREPVFLLNQKARSPIPNFIWIIHLEPQMAFCRLLLIAKLTICQDLRCKEASDFLASDNNVTNIVIHLCLNSFRIPGKTSPHWMQILSLLFEQKEIPRFILFTTINSFVAVELEYFIKIIFIFNHKTVPMEKLWKKFEWFVD